MARLTPFAVAVALFAAMAVGAAPASASKLTYATPHSGVAAPGSQITVSWLVSSAPSSTDWIGLYRYGAADTQYLQWFYTNGRGTGNGLFTLSRSLTPGLYELRLFARNSFTRLASVTLQVVEPSFGVGFGFSPGGTNYSHQTVTVGWSGILAPSAADWIGIYSYGAPNTAYRAFWYTGGGMNGSKVITLPHLPQGWYELRLFSNGGYTRLNSNTAALYSKG